MKALLVVSIIAWAGHCSAQCGSSHRLVGWSGPLTSLAHSVAGQVIVLDDCTIEVANFTYDGTAPAVHWWGAASASVADQRLGSEVSTFGRLSRAYIAEKVNVTLAAGVTLDSFKSFGVWCKNAEANFGNIIFPSGPASAPVTAAPVSPYVGFQGILSSLGFGVAGELEIFSESQFVIRGFNYNGLGTSPLTVVGAANVSVLSASSSQIVSAAIPNQAAQASTLMLRLVPTAAWSAIGAVGVVGNGGQLLARAEVGVPISDLNQLFDSCINLSPNFVLQWRVLPTSVRFGYTSIVSDNSWIGFGNSGAAGNVAMVNGDPVVAGVWRGAPWVDDFYLSARSQCNFPSSPAAAVGVCPDSAYGSAGNVGLRHYKHELATGVRTFVFERDMQPSNSTRSKPINVNDNVFAIWAQGPVSPNDLLRPVVLYHGSSNHASATFALRLAEQVKTCVGVVAPPSLAAPAGSVIEIRNIRDFTVTIGPNPNYPNPPGWGISYHINNVESPVLVVERGVTYTFSIRGGVAHPFYITDSIAGGGRQGEKIFAGGLSTAGDDSTPFVLKWTPDASTPDLVYYQCYVHQRLGWQIKVTSSPVTSSAVTIQLRFVNCFCAAILAFVALH